MPLFYFIVRDRASHEFLSVTGLTTDVLTIVQDIDYATSWSNRADAQAYADKLNDDFSHEFANRFFEVYPYHFA